MYFLGTTIQPTGRYYNLYLCHPFYFSSCVAADSPMLLSLMLFRVVLLCAELATPESLLDMQILMPILGLLNQKLREWGSEIHI